jgi:alkylation response protein AidB-like acyl-CoA dehydrogenase
MYQWNDEHQMIRAAVRQYVEAEIEPLRDELEFGDLPPYDLLRGLFATFGMDQMARDGFDRAIERERAAQVGEDPNGESAKPAVPAEGAARDPSMTLIPIIELCRVCPGMVTAMGVSMGLTASAIMSKGTIDQKVRWARDLLSFDKIGAWAITEPGSGSDAFGSMKASAKRDGDGYLLSGSKTFITNGPYADTIVFICKLDEGQSARGAGHPAVRVGYGHGRPHPVQAPAKDGASIPAQPANCSSTRFGWVPIGFWASPEEAFRGAGGRSASKGDLFDRACRGGGHGAGHR